MTTPMTKRTLLLACMAYIGFIATTYAATPTTQRTAPTTQKKPTKANAYIVEIQRNSGDIHVKSKSGLTPKHNQGGWQFDGAKWRLKLTRTAFQREDLSITVPAGAQIKVKAFNGSIRIDAGAHHVQAQTLSGDITINAATGNVTAKTVNGDISLSKVKEATASTVSGQIQITDAKGHVHANSVSGSITLLRCHSNDLYAQAVSGSVYLRQSPVKKAVLKTFSGQVEIHGPLAAKARLSAFATSGDIDVLWPKGVGVSVQASSQTGDNHIPSQLPRGNTQLQLSTLSGDINWRWK